VSQFAGAFRHAVDRKGRMSVPTQLSEGLALSADGIFVVVPGPEGCLDAYPTDEWTRRVQIVRSMPGGRLGRFYRRAIIGEARECRIDGHNRILVPPEILRRVGITNSVLIKGQLDHLELWKPEAFEAYMASQTITIEDAIEEIDARLEKRRRDDDR
jgi:MraZ protein